MASGGSRPGAGRKRKDPALAMTAAERAKLPVTPASCMTPPLHLSDLAQLLFRETAAILEHQGRADPSFSQLVAILAQRQEQIQRWQAVLETRRRRGGHRVKEKMMAANNTPAFARAIAGALSAVSIAALAIATPALKTDEGKVNVGYLDLAKIPTECFGHTGPEVRVGVRRSNAYCQAKLQGDAEKHLRGVLACTPTLADRRYQLAAATRTAFNIGVAAFCKSTIARKFNARDWRGGCDAILLFNKARVRGQLVVVAGLAKRRARERAMCLTDL